MEPEKGEDGPDPNRGSGKRDADRAALRDARLAEALRSNLKRRKDQARGRGAASRDSTAADGPVEAPGRGD